MKKVLLVGSGGGKAASLAALMASVFAEPDEKKNRRNKSDRKRSRANRWR